MLDQPNRRYERNATRRLAGAFVLAVVLGAGGGIVVLKGAQAPPRPSAPAATPAAARTSMSRITRVQLDKIESPAFEGRTFGAVGKYEVLSGKAFAELDPADPHNAVIVNLDNTPRNARGLVEYSFDVRIMKPIDGAAGKRTIFYDVLNRGAQRALNINEDYGVPTGTFPKGKAADLGDGFMLEEGYTLVWSGWQGDLNPSGDLLLADLPIAKGPGGRPIQRWITTEFIFNRADKSAHLQGDGAKSYAAVEASMPKAMLYRRPSPHAPIELIPRDSWSFAKCEEGTPVPSNVDICLPAGFSSNYVYQLVYEAQDPIVMGLGFAGIRDFVSFLRNDTTSANPLVARSGGQNPIRNALIFGQSQSGRFIRDWIWQGFNEDTQGRQVFEGAIPMTSGNRRTYTNFTFSEPGRFSRQAEDHYMLDDQFPFTYDTTTDPLTGKIDGLLARCRATGTCPKIMQWDSASEFWVGHASLVLTDALGTRDLTLPENVRYYLFSSTQHLGGTGAEPGPETRGSCQQMTDPNPYRETQRALIVALQAWMTAGTLPPASRHPKLSDGTLLPAVPQAAQGFPAIPGVRYTGKYNDMFVNDFLALPTKHTTAEYRVLVPKVDKDGNDLAGVRTTMIQVPIGTYTGWNTRRAGFMEDEVCGTSGGYVPFAKKAADRGADPRLSLEERYGTQAKYVDMVRAAAAKLQQDRFLLPKDAERLVRVAQERNLGLPASGSSGR